MPQQLSLFDIEPAPQPTPSAKEQILALRKELAEANRLYYVESAPTMSDREFDEKMHLLEALEAKHPELFDPNSPTQKVGSDLVESKKSKVESRKSKVESGEGEESGKKFKQIKHRYPMLSLANTYSEEEIRQWLERVYKGLEGEREVEIVCELKYDGLSISLWYENGQLTHALTRGDGLVGDDVLANIKTIPTIPANLETLENLEPLVSLENLELRGEVLLPWENFERLNREREANEEPLFANPRNAASGTLKLLDPKEVAHRGLVTYLYYMLGDNLPGHTHSERLDAARKMGFPVSDAVRVCHSVDEVMDYIHYWDVERKNLPVATDGVVLKVNDIRQQQMLGYTAKTPRWAIAYKFEAEKAVTRLLSISYQVGRTGAITPVANLEPVQLSGTMVRRATLNNEDFIRQMGIHEGCMVEVIKGGEIIPKIITSLPPDESGTLSPKGEREDYHFITHCPVCGSPLVRIEGEAAWRCPNDAHCPPQQKGKMEHFVARKAMNIDGLGAETIDLFFEQGFLRTVADIYHLDPAKIAVLPGFGEKSAERIMQGIEASKQVPWHRVLFALGIRMVGETTAKKLAKHFPSIDALYAASVEELTAIEDVGEIVAQNIIDHLLDEGNRAIIESLRESGVQLVGESRDHSATTSGPLLGQSIVISGVFKHHSRDEYKELIERHGGKNVGSISKKTHFVLAGENMGPSKLEKAEQLGITILQEDEFLAMIGE